jgi:hypothetical protein
MQGQEQQSFVKTFFHTKGIWVWDGCMISTASQNRHTINKKSPSSWRLHKCVSVSTDTHRVQNKHSTSPTVSLCRLFHVLFFGGEGLIHSQMLQNFVRGNSEWEMDDTGDRKEGKDTVTHHMYDFTPNNTIVDANSGETVSDKMSLFPLSAF